MTKAKGDRKVHVVTAYAESAAGPGWGNSPVWVILRDEAGRLSRQCLQPDEHTAEMRTLYAISQVAHFSMGSAVERCLAQRKKSKRG